MVFEFGSSSFQAAARKLLQEKAAPTPAPVVAPSPDLSATLMCRDIKTGAAVRCQNPHTLIIIVAGMACMMFLVTIALLLLCWSVVRQRRTERQRREAGDAADPTSSSGEAAQQQAAPATPALAPVDSQEFDDAVFVQLPGDEKPQFFALPKPFLAENYHQQDAKNVTDVVVKDGDKEPSSENPSSETDGSNPVVENSCVPSSR